MKGTAHQPTDCIGGAPFVKQNVAWVRIRETVAYCEPGSAQLIVSLWPGGKVVINETIYPMTSGDFEASFPEQYVDSINFSLNITDWTVAINNVTVDWTDAAQAPNGLPPPPPPPPPEACTPYESKCEGFTLWQCQWVGGVAQWVSIEDNSAWCGYPQPPIPPPPTPPVEWKLLDTKFIVLKPLPLAGWKLLDTKFIVVKPRPLDGWIFLDKKCIVVKPGALPPPPDEDEDWWASIYEWLTENWYAAVAAIILFLIGIFVWVRYK